MNKKNDKAQRAETGMHSQQKKNPYLFFFQDLNTRDTPFDPFICKIQTCQHQKQF